MSEKTKGEIRNEQSRDIDNIGHKKHNTDNILINDQICL